MQARTKKLSPEKTELKFIGPVVNMAKAIESLKPLGFVDASDSVPWREACLEYSEEQLVDKTLAGARNRED